MEDPRPRIPHNNKFKQQQLDGWQPIATPTNTVIVLALVGAFLLAIGGLITDSNLQLKEVSKRYDQICQENVAASLNPSMTSVCNVTMQITEDMENNSPMRFSYELSNYYQNYRRYVKSRSDWQLADVTGPTDICTPLETFDNGAGSRTLYPCGLVASSFFNDTFVAFHCPSGAPCTRLDQSNGWQRQGISWRSDRDKKFIARPLRADETDIGPNGFPLTPIDDEDFIVWMRAAGLPTFRKLYSKVDRNFAKGDRLIVQINSNYPVSPFSGSKSIVLEEVNWMNGKNEFLGPL
mmetsp:Transcript_12928/g.17859  ORF Transcript_12928/g.17859 Transcript_12928/m.17859 type:complete len:293 (+) Transcript_12928:83-961(+)